MTATRPIWRRRQTVPTLAGASRTGQSWRVTTAVRAFTLALVVGQILNAHVLAAAALALIGLGTIGAVCSVVEIHQGPGRSHWTSVAEGILVCLLIGTGEPTLAPLLTYAAVPIVVAGVRHGRMTTTNTALASVLTVAVMTAGQDPQQVWSRVEGTMTWLAIGLGGGMLAATQTRSLRKLEAAQAPFAAAHRLVGQLHHLVREAPVAFDVPAQARAVLTAVRAIVDADAVVLVQTDRNCLEAVAAHTTLESADEEVGRLCLAYGQSLHRDGVVGFPLRVGQHVFGALVLRRWTSLTRTQVEAVQLQLDEHAIRLETALLVEDVRRLATNEERSRLARDIHDGVAQRIVSLGYLADDVSAFCEDPRVRQGVEELREAITRLVAELRFSVFDLRQQVDNVDGVSGALSEYVRELSSHSDLRVHLTLDERGTRLSRRTQAELLRIAQEAIGNVHKHARAINVWVSLTVDGSDVRLVVEDDGIGGAAPRSGHYGMHTMRERAARMDADLEVGTRHDGGTVVTLRSRTSITSTMGAHHDERLARR